MCSFRVHIKWPLLNVRHISENVLFRFNFVTACEKKTSCMCFAKPRIDELCTVSSVIIRHCPPRREVEPMGVWNSSVEGQVICPLKITFDLQQPAFVNSMQHGWTFSVLQGDLLHWQLHLTYGVHGVALVSFVRKSFWDCWVALHCFTVNPF